MNLAKAYVKFSLSTMLLMYGTFASCALIHELGHALCAWIEHEPVTRISVGTGPLLLKAGLLQIHAWMLGGQTSIQFTGSSIPSIIMTILSGSLAVLLVQLLCLALCKRVSPAIRSLLKGAACLTGLMIAVDLTPVPGRDGGIIAVFLGTSSFIQNIRPLWMIVCYAFQTFWIIDFFMVVIQQICPLIIKESFLSLFGHPVHLRT